MAGQRWNSMVQYMNPGSKIHSTTRKKYIYTISLTNTKRKLKLKISNFTLDCKGYNDYKRLDIV